MESRFKQIVEDHVGGLKYLNGQNFANCLHFVEKDGLSTIDFKNWVLKQELAQDVKDAIRITFLNWH